MYEIYYDLTGPPFQLTPDSRFFYESRAHARAFAHLTFGLAQGEGFVVVTGEVGAGKTTLVERLLRQLDPSAYVVARVNTTQVSGDDLFRLAMAGFGVDVREASKSTLLLRFEAALHDYRLSGQRCLLIVDEAQNLSLAALEELRMLSNITESGDDGTAADGGQWGASDRGASDRGISDRGARAGMQTILLGQPQFRRKLASPDLDQLRQRVLASYHLGPLSREETRLYILHRLTTAGWHDLPRWHDAAFAAVYDHSAGIPRRINRLCARVLLYGALEEAAEISGEMVATAAEELAEDLQDGLAPPPAGGPDWPRSGQPDHAQPDHAEPDDPQAPATLAELGRRLAALEARLARRDRLMVRLLRLLHGKGGPR